MIILLDRFVTQIFAMVYRKLAKFTKCLLKSLNFVNLERCPGLLEIKTSNFYLKENT